ALAGEIPLERRDEAHAEERITARLRELELRARREQPRAVRALGAGRRVRGDDLAEPTQLLGPIPPGSRELGEPLPGVDGWRNRRRMPLDVARQRARGPGLIAALEPQLRRAPCGLAAHR